MNDSLSCRKASKKDLSEILRLYAQPEMDNGKILSLTEAERIFEKIEAYPDYAIYVAIYRAEIIGSFGLLIMNNLGHLGASSAVIEDVVVDPQWQGRGVGKMMMQKALQICEEKGCYKATVSSNLKREQAHEFYKALGFELHGYSLQIMGQPKFAPDRG
jgi:GNAT superfamily N-acetyltransferase